MTEREVEEKIHQRAWTGQKPGLERISRLLERLGNPQNELKFVHIAGSNGKGSTAAMLASVLTAAGLKTGLYTSPHLWSFRERFQVDGVPIPEEDFANIAAQVLEQTEDGTEFDLMTAIAMLYFRNANCDIVVLETGLGGRLDSTNIIDAPEAAVVTNIGLEHTQLLGNTLEKIAAEKAGIIKQGCFAVLYRQSPEVCAVIEDTCRRNLVPLTVSVPVKALSAGLEGQTFTYRGKGPYRISLPGAYQLRNAALVLETVDVLRARGWRIPEPDLIRGLDQARWPGRMELARRRPDVILDGGHNPQCMEALSQSLRTIFPENGLIVLCGMLADKDWRAMAEEMRPLARKFFTITPDSPRALPAQALADYLGSQGAQAVCCQDLQAGLNRALDAAGPDGAVCVCGSLYLIGAARHLLGLC